MNGTNVIMFQDRFAALIRNGTKTTTIRLPRKRPILPGDELSLRMWTGKPYRSPQKILMRSRCVGTERFCIGKTIGNLDCFVIGEALMIGTYLDKIAVMDGFQDREDMIGWFRCTHGLPFEGVRIFWGAPL